MPITTHCDCGRRIRAKDEAAGRKIRCPDCHAVVRLPGGNSGSRRRKSAETERPRKKKARPKNEEPDYGEMDFGELAALERESEGLGQGDLEPCISCGESIGSKARECPYCGELVQHRKRELKQADKRRREQEEEFRERVAVDRSNAMNDDDDDGSGLGCVIWVIIFVIGNFILYHTTGWVIIPGRRR
jgi:predicted RNA-binding Zn-ribbon protein involved in translation (DUF1610 family)